MCFASYDPRLPFPVLSMFTVVILPDQSYSFSANARNGKCPPTTNRARNGNSVFIMRPHRPLVLFPIL